MKADELHLLLNEVRNITHKVAQFIKEERTKFNVLAVQEKKGYSDLVSYVDKEAERLLVTHLKALNESFGFITEEDTPNVKKEYNWIIDPLDGTTNFIHDLPVYSISIALESQGNILLGVVEDIAQGDCFYATKGGGAYKNETQLFVTKTYQLQDTLIATGFPYYDFDRIESYMRLLQQIMSSTRGIRRMGSAAIDLAYTAAGRFDAFFEYNLNAWDVAAGILLVEEAGGVVTEWNGGSDPLFGRSILAGNKPIHTLFLELMKEW